MSIHIILGKPGSGKSFYATRRLIDELSDTNRNIVTNLPLRLDALNEYLQQRWPERDLRALQRIRLLADEEMRFFWKFRAPADCAPPVLAQWNEEQNEQRKGALFRELDAWAKTATTSDNGAGVAYFLDEAHIPFNARAWASVASAALFYLSQHRKLGDIVWPITQAPSNLDKQFRSVAEDFTRVRNEYTAKFGVFKGRGRFVRKTFLSEPTAANVEPFETATFSLDGMEKCYDTARGIGVHGSKADIGRRAKGINILWVMPAALVLALACVAVPWALGKAGGSYIAGKGSAKGDAAAVDVAKAAPVVASAVPVAVAASPVGFGRESPSVPSVTVRGYVMRGARVNVILSDGRILTENDPELTMIGRNGVTVNGQKLFMARPDYRPPAPVAKEAAKESAAVSSPLSDYVGEALFQPGDGLSRLEFAAMRGSSAQGSQAVQGSAARR